MAKKKTAKKAPTNKKSNAKQRPENTRERALAAAKKVDKDKREAPAEAKPSKDAARAWAKRGKTQSEAEVVTPPEQIKKGKPKAQPRAVQSAEAKPKSERKRGGAHPKHPPCPGCKRALYKSMSPGPVKKDDPWAYCRNKVCDLYGVNQASDETQPTDEEPASDEPKVDKPTKSKKAKGKKAKATEAPEAGSDELFEQTVVDAPATEGESDDEESDGEESDGEEVVAAEEADDEESDDDLDDDGRVIYEKSRTRIRKALEESGPFSSNIIGLAMSMVKKACSVEHVVKLYDEFNGDGQLEALGVERPG